jgi:hypothetical protein
MRRASLASAAGASAVLTAVTVIAVAVAVGAMMRAETVPVVAQRAVCLVERVFPPQRASCAARDPGGPLLLRVSDPGPPGSRPPVVFHELHPSATITPNAPWTGSVRRDVGARVGSGARWQIRAGAEVRVEREPEPGSWTATLPGGGALLCYGAGEADCAQIRAMTWSERGVERVRTAPGLAMGIPARQAAARQALDALLFWANPGTEVAARRLGRLLDVTDRALDFWSERGATLPSTITFQPGGSGGVFHDTDRSATVRVGDLVANPADRSKSADAVLAFVVAHEIGHGVQPEWPGGGRYRRFPREMENQASCLAGYFMGHELEQGRFDSHDIAAVDAAIRRARQRTGGPPPAEEAVWFRHGVEAWERRETSAAACPD